MSLPLGVAVCEDDLRRDLTFLKAFAGPRVDLRVTPLSGGTLNGKVVRLLQQQINSMREAGLQAQAIVVHHDVDRGSLGSVRRKIERWFAGSGLGQTQCKLVICAPHPCLERWLCAGLDVRVQRPRPSDGCEPYKRAWERSAELDLDRVRKAAGLARRKLLSLDDFSSFFEDWKRAGLEVS